MEEKIATYKTPNDSSFATLDSCSSWGVVHQSKLAEETRIVIRKYLFRPVFFININIVFSTEKWLDKYKNRRKLPVDHVKVVAVGALLDDDVVDVDFTFFHCVDNVRQLFLNGRSISSALNGGNTSSSLFKSIILLETSFNRSR